MECFETFIFKTVVRQRMGYHGNNFVINSNLDILKC